MTNQKPIEPLPSREFITGMWHAALRKESGESTARQTFATWLVQWGFNRRAALNEAELQRARDEELEAIIDWMMQMGYWGEDGKAIPALRAARRPNPKSQAEEALERCNDYIDPDGTIRAALERLRELEGNQ
jgi:hypothetical protein